MLFVRILSKRGLSAVDLIGQKGSERGVDGHHDGNELRTQSSFQ